MKLSNSNLGALHELKACTFLLEQGYTVFRNISPVGKADLVAWKKESMFLIDVGTTAAHKSKDGSIKIYSPKAKQTQCIKLNIRLLLVDQLTETIFFDSLVDKELGYEP